MGGKNLFHLTNSESERVSRWITENDYLIHVGYFELEFTFTPSFGDYIELTYFLDDKRFVLNVNDDSLVDDPQRTVSHIVIGDQHVKLELSDEALELYFQINREITEAHVNEDCEPPGSTLIFEIHCDHCNVLSGQRQLIEARK